MPPRTPPALPHPDDPPLVWRRFATASLAAPATRRALLAALATRPEPVREAAVPALVARTRGGVRRDVVAAVAAMGAPGPGTVYALVGELLASSGATREPCVAALRLATPDAQAGIALALSAAARVHRVRNGGEREAAALAAWRDAGGADPLADADGPDLWRAWLDGRDLPAALDHALLLATAGAPRAVVEQLRKVVEHVVALQGRASTSAAGVLRWLADESAAEDLPASVRNPAWRETAAEALAVTAIAAAGHAATLRHVAGTLRAGPLERAVAVAALRACVLAARTAGDAATALDDTLDALVGALAAVTAGAPEYPALVGLLLGREPRGTLLGAGRWLTDDARARVHTVALANAALAARDLALADLEAHGVPPAVVPALRELARVDPDPVTRQHARQLARGEHIARDERP